MRLEKKKVKSLQSGVLGCTNGVTLTRANDYSIENPSMLQAAQQQAVTPSLMFGVKNRAHWTGR